MGQTSSIDMYVNRIEEEGQVLNIDLNLIKKLEQKKFVLIKPNRGSKILFADRGFPDRGKWAVVTNPQDRAEILRRLKTDKAVQASKYSDMILLSSIHYVIDESIPEEEDEEQEEQEVVVRKPHHKSAEEGIPASSVMLYGSDDETVNDSPAEVGHVHPRKRRTSTFGGVHKTRWHDEDDDDDDRPHSYYSSPELPVWKQDFDEESDSDSEDEDAAWAPRTGGMSRKERLLRIARGLNEDEVL